MTDWRCAEPQWIHLAWAVLALTVLMLWLDQRGTRGLERFLAAVMHERLVRRPTTVRRTGRILLLAAAAMAMIVALMRPQSGFREITTPRVGARLMVCLDVSRSMLAEDATPNRLERAKIELLDLLDYIDRDHVGLIAFAGKATVLAPLTSDFGFLRTVIQSAGPWSVARGGTDLASPIRKAVEGFRGRTDLSRVIILITDGEHHDQFVLDAAKQAGEAGVRIICIGFGDAAGSRVEITDPVTGAQTTLTDDDGQPVITRLDRETLGRIAAATDGIFIPAGTGVLDLQAIYDQHIAPLTRGALDDHRRIVKRERYQWPLLAALLMLLAAQFVARPRRARTSGDAGPLTAAAAVTVAALWATPAATAEDPAPSPPEETARGETTGTSAEEEAPDPRVSYNGGVAALNGGRLDAAEEAFTLARRHAGTDAQSRYRATYNLGWVEVRRADAALNDEPAVALDHLHAAEQWFRDATGLDPESAPPRENMEIVARRAMALADALRQDEEVSIETVLDALVDAQRAVAESLRESFAGADGPQDETVRRTCQALEVEQRAILTRLDDAADRIRQNLASLEAEGEQSAEDALRHAQLGGAQAYLFQASQRVGQTRRHLRGRQLERAYRRAAVALGELKRSRDQLRNVVQILGAVVADAMEMTRHAALLHASGRGLDLDGEDGVERPAWLTRAFLADTHDSVRLRTEEIAARLKAGIEGATKAPEDPPAEKTTDAAADAELRQTLEAAWPLVEAAGRHFAAGAEAIASQRDGDLYAGAAQGTAKLVEAHELFLDMAGLIETIHRDQVRLRAMVSESSVESVEQIRDTTPRLRHLQQSNLQRGTRLGTMIQREQRRLETSAANAAASDDPSDAAAPSEAEDQRKRFDAAHQLLASALQAFGGVDKVLGRFEGDGGTDQDLTALRHGVGLSVDQLEALRRLFFTIVQHLRETLQRQVALTDTTRDLLVTANNDQRDTALQAPAARQRELRETTRQIAASLRSQSERNPNPGGAPGQAAPQADGEAARLARAAAIVLLAADAMTNASEAMVESPAKGEPVLDAQRQAIERLAEALSILQPPPPDQDTPPEQDPGQDQAPRDSGGGDDGDESQAGSPEGDMSRLLQAVRDRDAQRQRRRQQQGADYAPVEKDW